MNTLHSTPTGLEVIVTRRISFPMPRVCCASLQPNQAGLSRISDAQARESNGASTLPPATRHDVEPRKINRALAGSKKTCPVKFKFKYPWLTATLAFVAILFVGFKVGVFAPSAAIVLLVAFQLLTLALSSPQAALFETLVSQQTVNEIDAALRGCHAFFTEYESIFKLFKRHSGDIETIVKDHPEIRTQLNKLRKAQLGAHHNPTN